MRKIILLFVPLIILGGCVNNDNMFKLAPEYLARRQVETRNFETQNAGELLSASAQVLQDLGFTITESETKLGLITATKDRTAGSTAGMIFTIAFGGQNARYDVKQRLYANIVIAKVENGHNVRAKVARIVWNNRDETRTEEVEDAETYRDFFDKLSQSVFLTAHDI